VSPEVRTALCDPRPWWTFVVPQHFYPPALHAEESDLGHPRDGRPKQIPTSRTPGASTRSPTGSPWWIANNNSGTSYFWWTAAAIPSTIFVEADASKSNFCRSPSAWLRFPKETQSTPHRHRFQWQPGQIFLLNKGTPAGRSAAFISLPKTAPFLGWNPTVNLLPGRQSAITQRCAGSRQLRQRFPIHGAVYKGMTSGENRR